MFTISHPPGTNSPSGKEGKPIENGVLVNEVPGKLMHRCVVLLACLLACFHFHPVIQLWTSSNLVFMVFVRRECVVPDPAV